MQTKKLHSWNFSYSQAMALQKSLADKVQLIQLKKQPKTIAGLDCALSPDGTRIIAAVVILKTPEMAMGLWEPIEKSDFEVVETSTATQELTFPYIPGLLSFREAPACIEAVEKLRNEPDAFIIDGQGIAHPRRLGLATHLGLFFDKPTIGCAKSRLIGQFEEPSLERGAYSLLKDKKSIEPQTRYDIQDTRYETIGAVVRTRSNVKPVFVSVGNKCLLQDAIEIVLNWTTKYRLPEPTRLAHQMVTEMKTH